uniref:Dmx-like 2 n=1 Tax=Astyanax mexicanus TaxID=7994 RepID=A0A8B9HDR3_ASTMX
MHLHQVLTGAVNPGDCCYSVGSVNDIPFTVGQPAVRHFCCSEGSISDCSLLTRTLWVPQSTAFCSNTNAVEIWKSKLTVNIRNCTDRCVMVLGKNTISYMCYSLSFAFCRTAAAVLVIKWSPDGEYFATVGKDDCLLKVWYPTTGWKSAMVIPEVPDRKAPLVHFSFVYLAHPRTVTGFSWRKTSKYMPKGSVCNVLLTSCVDGICRLWSETLLPEDSLLGGQITENSTSVSSSLPHSGQKDKIQHALESIHHLKQLRRGRRRSSALVAHTELLPSQLGSHETHRHITHHASALCHFHISASINPNTDIPAALAGSGLFSPTDGSGGFVVHWLNNKDLSFTSSMDQFMQQLRKFSDLNINCISPVADLDEMSDKASEHEEGEQEGSTKASSPGSSSSMPQPSVLLDRKMEALTLEWNKSPDMLFTIHPVDGSFLVWHVKYLDEFIPGIFRQVQVAFSSRIPVAFPTGDANSLSKNIMMYACTFIDRDGEGALDSEKKDCQVTQSASASAGLSSLGHSLAAVIGPAVMMVSKHVDGSLNQWAVTFAEKSAFSNVLTVSHKYRYCGHRFHLNDLACHTVLPLLLTSSHHNALLTPPSGPGSSDGDQEGGPLRPVRPMRGVPQKQMRNAATRTFHDPNAIYSELILWRVDHIGPLSCTGGVSELARINSLHTSAFSNVAWLPTLVPSSVLGTYCNSASACFVASDGKNLRLYQAVVDARKLLDELSDPETSVSLLYSVQLATCALRQILLHVSVKNYRPPPFSEKFFLVVIEKDENRNSVLQMWHLHLKSVQACVGESTVLIHWRPFLSHLSSSSIYPVCLAPYLLVMTCSDNRVRFWRCAVETDTSAPDPEESRTYCWEPWCLLNEEEDNNSALVVSGRPVAVSCSYTGRLAVAFKQLVPSYESSSSKDFSMHVSIYECESTGGSEWVLEQTIHLDDFSKPTNALDSRVSVDSNLVVYSKSDLFVTKDSPNIKHFVHLDWLSKEDGSHILTVGVGSNILMYGRISGIVTEQTGGKDGMAVITLPLGGSVKQGVRSRWVLLRAVDLVSSVDGTPSLPVSLSWVRDGILVIGMDCEMHVYAQWHQDKKPGNAEDHAVTSPDDGSRSASVPAESRGRSKSVFESGTAIDDVFRVPAVIQDGGLFEAAHSLSPTLPQYHPTQLLELMDLGKVRRAKAILSHLVKCIAGEVAVVRDIEGGEGGGRRHLSRTISVTGSTAKDTIVAGRDGGRDYTEINSIPPLPLYALLSADLDTSYKAGEEMGKGGKGQEREIQKSSEDQYADLFQVQAVTTDDFVSFASEKPEKKTRVINLSMYGPTYFGPEHAQVLSSHLMHSSLPGLTRLEQMFLVALADTVATTSAEVGGATDKQYTGCLFLFFLFLLFNDPYYCFFLCVFLHIDYKLNIKTAFQRNNDPLDAALFYLAMKKKAVLWGLFRSQHDEKMTQFFSHNFNEDRWRKAALKNAFSLLGKQRFEQSAAFFLLAGSLKDAIEVCLEKMEDIQLAMIVARLYESDFESSSTCQGILYEKVLGCKRDGTGFSCTKLHPDPFLRSIAFWIMKDYTKALDTLLEQTPKEDDENPDVMVKSCNPVVFSFYNYLRTHPLIIRRHFAGPDTSVAPVGLTSERSSADEINLIERKLFFTTANAHFKVGCPVLALEVLSKIPKVTKKALSKGSSQGNVSASQPQENGGRASDLNWSAPVPTQAWGADSSAGLDWSQPLIKTEDEGLQLDWGENKDEDEDEEEEDGGLTMKKPEPSEKAEHLQRSDSASESEVDVIAEQLKFRACLKILMTELRTLATGYEVDGGKLRFQLYNWLEKEIEAMHRICNYKVEGKEVGSELEKWGGEGSIDLDDSQERGEAGAYERHQLERRRLQAKQLHAERRKAWLRKNQALLRVFLSYCSLHGAKGGGVTSVRMELLFLLQESQQVCVRGSEKELLNELSCFVCCLFVLQVHALHTLAASLSACIYQALCDSHSYSSQTEANQFTGMVYQGLLLSERRRLRTESIEEHATPTSAPAQWPGVASLISLLVCAQGEEQPRLNVMLCEAVVAVYLSLLIHGLGTHSGNELFRLAAHPLNNRMWAAVFGGGAKLIVKPKRPPEIAPAVPPPTPPAEDVDRQRRRFNMRMLVPGRPVKETPATPPPIPTERPTYKEKFIPPELNLPVTSPLCNAVLKCLENWEQQLLDKMNKFDGPPPNYINTYPTDVSAGGGPAILRHKAMLEPDNTPFRAKHHLSFPVRRLWHFLVKQEILQETLMRYIFTKKRKQSEVMTGTGNYSDVLIHVAEHCYFKGNDSAIMLLCRLGCHTSIFPYVIIKSVLFFVFLYLSLSLSLSLQCGVADGEGFLSLWQVNQTSSNPKPYLSWQCHSKTCGDFSFITSSSLIATAGHSNDGRNVCLWDTLISPSNTMVHGKPKHTETFAHHVWKLAGHGLMHSFSTEHAKQSIFRNIGAGVMQIETCPGNRIFTCGADGTLKMRVLPDRYNIPASIFDIL